MIILKTIDLKYNKNLWIKRLQKIEIFINQESVKKTINRNRFQKANQFKCINLKGNLPIMKL
jgi:hypothetical protein